VVRVDPASGPAGPKSSWAARLQALRRGWGVVSLALAIFVGIYAGIFTVNEAAAIGAALAFLFAAARRRLTWRSFVQTLAETASTTGMIYMILIGSNILTYFVTSSGMPEAMVAGIKALDAPPLAVLAVLLVAYIILGAVFEEVSAMLITMPFVLPLVVGYGYHPVWWGIIMVVVIEIGMICPPIGLNVFVVHNMTRDVPMKTIYAGIMPFLYAEFVLLAVLVLFPGLTMWLPNAMGMK
jgi:tripartite ATP-independent transporter DctM subunit